MMILESSVLILLVLTVRKFFAGRVSYRLLYSLWGLVLLKLLLPFDFISAPLSLRSLLVPKQSVNVDRTESFMEEEAVQEKTLFYEDRTEEEGGRNRKEAAGIIQKEKTEDNGKEAAGTIRKEKTEDNGKEKKEEPEDSLQKRQPKPAAEEIPVPKKTQITYVIMGISVLFFAVVFCANLHFMMKLRKQRILYDGSGKIPVYVTGLVPVPCLYGIFPAVYLSEAAAKMPEKEVRQIILHETMHYRQGDHIWSFFRTALLCIYWFHPFIYPAFFASREDAELSCDEAVIRMIGNEERFDYGRLLLALSGQTKKGMMFHAGTMFSGKGKAMEKRIKAIGKKKKLSYVCAVAVVAAAVIVTAASFSSGEQKQPDTKAAGQKETGAETEKEKEMEALPQETEDDSWKTVYESFLKEKAQEAEGAYYSFAYLSTEESGENPVPALLLSNYRNSSDHASSSLNVYRILDGKAALCGKARCSSSGEYVGVYDGKLYTDTHHSVTGAWLDGEKSGLVSETFVERYREDNSTDYYYVDKDGEVNSISSAEYGRYFFLYGSAPSVIFKKNPFAGGKSKPISFAMEEYQKNLNDEYKMEQSYQADLDGDGNKETISINLENLYKEASGGQKDNLVVMSGKDNRILWSAYVDIAQEKNPGIYVYQDRFLLVWQHTKEGEKEIYEWQIFSFDADGTKSTEKPERVEMEGEHAGKQWKKFMKELNKKLSDAACIIDFNRQYWYFDICNPDSSNRELDETEASPLYRELMKQSAVQPYLGYVQSAEQGKRE